MHCTPSSMGAISFFPTTTKVRRRNPVRDVQELFDDALRRHMAGRIDDAVLRYKRALILRPDHADGHNNLGVALAAQGRIDDAMERYRRAISLKPDSAAAHGNLGVALAAKGRFDDAVTHYVRALALRPGDAGMHYNLGIALVAQGRIEEAAAHYRRALVIQPGNADAHNNLGTLLEAQGDSDQAMAHYRRATAIKPRHAEAHNNLGNLFREQGKFPEAIAHYERAISIAPGKAEAHFHRAEIKTFHAEDADLAPLEALARNNLPANKAPYIHFALAKAFEDTGDCSRAFEHLRKGNTLKRGQIDYNEKSVANLFESISNAFSTSLLDSFAGAGDPSSAPVFVLGMPRSGSSLIEQILASHPQVHGAGERNGLPAVARDVLGAHDRSFPFPECVCDLDGATLRRIGAAYLAALPALADGQLRIVDKLPANFLGIGLIRLILPNARIIHSVRNPLDTCVSCYSRLFASGQHFTYDLAELGRYYRRYSELMDHWRSVLPSDAMLDVGYENVVGDLEGQARRLIDYCGLPWDDRCLVFHRTIRPVKTASAVQVRSPLFRSSVERWRKFESWIGPLLEALDMQR